MDELVETQSVDKLVKLFAKNDGFVTHRQSNAADLTLKYEYLYSLSNKIYSEAKAI